MATGKLLKQDRRRYKGSIKRVRPWFKTRNGAKLKARLLQPADAPLLAEFFYQLSPATRRRRFHTNVENVDASLVAERAAEMANVDNETAEGAVVALVQESGGEQIVGVVRLARPPDAPHAPEAETAVVVRDDYHGQGVGTELLRRMVLLAKQMNVRTILAVFEPDNDDAIRLFRELDLPYTIKAHHGETEMRIEVPYS